MKAKKVIALALAAILLVCSSVMATVAYLTDKEKVVNTFTVGNVQIELHEEGETTRNDGTVGKDYHLQPGLTYAKDPTVTVNANSENCYVRVLVSANDMSKLTQAFPKEYDYSKWAIKSWYGEDGVFLLQNLVAGWDNSKWVYAGVNTDGAYEFRYSGIVEKSATDKALEPVFTNVVVPAEIDNAHLAYLQDAEITVTAHAIQAAGFNNAAEAWGAWSVNN